jgi:hypothetical protein
LLLEILFFFLLDWYQICLEIDTNYGISLRFVAVILVAPDILIEESMLLRVLSSLEFIMHFFDRIS